MLSGEKKLIYNCKKKTNFLSFLNNFHFVFKDKPPISLPNSNPKLIKENLSYLHKNVNHEAEVLFRIPFKDSQLYADTVAEIQQQHDANLNLDSILNFSLSNLAQLIRSNSFLAELFIKDESVYKMSSYFLEIAKIEFDTNHQSLKKLLEKRDALVIYFDKRISNKKFSSDVEKIKTILSQRGQILERSIKDVQNILSRIDEILKKK